jgi:DNA replication protein DnaC
VRHCLQQTVIIDNFYKADFATITTGCNETKLFCPKSKKWEKIFKDPMVTAAAIDRLVHHSVILELNISSFRMEKAKKSKDATKYEEKKEDKKVLT